MLPSLAGLSTENRLLTSFRQPVHTLYGGAHLFQVDTCAKMGRLALAAMDRFAASPGELARAMEIPEQLAERVHPRVRDKLEREPVEDFRIDFEDGYGVRADAEEDADAVRAAGVASRAPLPAFFGIRIKPAGERAWRTLQLFLDALGEMPANFVVTLPKIASLAEVEALADLTGAKCELMIETPFAVMNARALTDAARGRCLGAHFGAYDYAASLGIAAGPEVMRHPACDFARNMMQVSLAGTGVRLADGVTSILPVGDRDAVHAAWRLHYGDVRRSMANGFYQSWDLHPAQLVSRYAAVFAFFLERMGEWAERLKNFVARQAQATLVGSTFDDAATVRGLAQYFVRAIDSGAVTGDEVKELTGLVSLEEFL